MSAERKPTRTAWAAVILACLELTAAVLVQIPKPDTVLVPVPFGQFENIQWLNDPDTMSSTCGQFKAYVTDKSVDRVAGRWYTMYVSNIRSTTSYCSQLTNVHRKCGCFGIDFTTALREDLISFVMFSTNLTEMSATYELAVATLSGKSGLNMNQIILRSFVVQSNARISGKGAYIIPSAVVVDTDDFDSYMIVLICRERATKPVVMVLANALPMSGPAEDAVHDYLYGSGLDFELLAVDHSSCQYAQNIVGF